MKSALIIVDAEKDFFPGGPLGVPDADEIIEPLIYYMEFVDLIVFTQDWHPFDHFSFKDEPEFKDGSWPRHCVQYTKGAELDPRLVLAAAKTGKPVLTVHKGRDKDTEAYSGFDGTVVHSIRADGVLQMSLGDALDELGVVCTKIGGLTLDHCVRATTLDSIDDGYRTNLLVDGTRPIDYRAGYEALIEIMSHA